MSRPTTIDTPPESAPEAERQTIGSVLLDPRRLDAVAAIVGPDDWHDYRCGLAWRLLLRMRAAGAPIDGTTLVEWARADGVLADMGGAAQVAEWAHGVATAANAQHHAEIVRDRAIRLATYHACIEVASESRNGVATADLLARLTDTTAALTARAAGMAGERSGPILTCMADVEPCEVSWLWPGRIPLGRITLLVGRPGEGKSFLTIDAAARVSTGTPWPDGADCPHGSVLIMSAEDDPGDTIRPRLDASYADVRRVHLLSAVRRADGERMISLGDVDAIDAALASLTDCRLVVVDPIGSFLGGRTDAHRDNEVRSVLAPIAALAEKHGAAMLVVAHRRKSAGASADDSALGSRAFTGIARAVWHVSRDPESKARRLLLPGKNNLAPEGDGLAFAIIGEPGRVAWERDPVVLSADDALAAETKPPERRRGPAPEERDEAAEWLATALADGPRLAKDLLDEWRHGHGGSKSTLERGKKTLGAVAYRPQNPGPWWWRLQEQDATPPEHIATSPNSKQPEYLDDVPKNPRDLAIFGAENEHNAKFQKPGNVLPADGESEVVTWSA